MRRLASSRSSGAFHGWRGSVSAAAASVKITREFHCVVGSFLLPPRPVFFSLPRFPRHGERERLFRCSISANDEDGAPLLLFSSRTARPGGKAIIQFFIALHPLRKGYRVPSLPPTSLEGTVSSGKISFPLFFLFSSLSFFFFPPPPETQISQRNTRRSFSSLSSFSSVRSFENISISVKYRRFASLHRNVANDFPDSVSSPDENVY